MANGSNGTSKVAVFFLIVVMVACLLGGLYLIYIYSKGEKSPTEKQEEVNAEIEKYKAQAQAATATLANDRLKAWIIWGMILLTIGLVAAYYIRKKFNKEKDFLTIDEGEVKCKEWCNKKLSREPSWQFTDSYERREGTGKLYITVSGFYKWIDNHPVAWGATKILAYMNDDWHHARIENIPQGWDIYEAIPYIFHEMESKGFTIVRSKGLLEAQALVDLMDKRKAEDEVINKILPSGEANA